MWDKAKRRDRSGRNDSFDYIEYLSEGKRSLVALLERMQWRTDVDQEISNAKNWAHRIAGNAAMYGYDQLGLTARDLEYSLRLSKEARDPDDILAKLVRLINSIVRISKSSVKNELEISERPEVIRSFETPRAANKPVILMVGGSNHLYRMVSGLLRLEADFLHCETAESALILIESDPIDIVVIEEYIEDGSGFDLVNSLRDLPDYGRTPILMALLRDEPGSMIRAYQSGASACISKPFGPHELSQVIREQIDRQTPGVLLVDDDPVVHSLLKPRFEKEGFQVWTAENGQSALNVLNDKTPALIVLDRMMPGLNGAKVLSHVKSDPNLSVIPVIMLTTDSGGEEGHDWLSRGAADFVAKPFSPAEVVLRALRQIDNDKPA